MTNDILKKILELKASGKSYADIAKIFNYSRAYIFQELKRVANKKGLKTIDELIVLARSKGIIKSYICSQCGQEVR